MNTPLSADALANLAARAYQRRRDEARRQVAAGRVDPARAEAAMRPWAAVALVCGADAFALDPALGELLADYRVCQIYPGGQPGSLAERDARADLARDLCPPERRAAALLRAADDAGRQLAEGLPGAADRAREIATLCAALNIAGSGPANPAPANTNPSGQNPTGTNPANPNPSGHTPTGGMEAPKGPNISPVGSSAKGGQQEGLFA